MRAEAFLEGRRLPHVSANSGQKGMIFAANEWVAYASSIVLVRAMEGTELAVL